MPWADTSLQQSLPDTSSCRGDMRCDRGRALCGAVEEVRHDTQTYSAVLKTLRPTEQLDHIRGVLEAHDRGCPECGAWFIVDTD